MKKKLKFAFFVQGEGRGHLTQALSLERILREEGHDVVCMIVGKSRLRKIPDFFYKRSQSSIYEVDSPNFVLDKDKTINLKKTVLYNLMGAGKFLKSLIRIKTIIKNHKPDIIINFYEVIGGFHNLLSFSNIPFICIAKQYIASHPKFKLPEERKPEKYAMIFFNYLTSLRADKRLCLSFYPMENVHKKLRVIPPLLRKEVFSQKVADKNYFLVYILNSGYSEDIIRWHEKNKKIFLQCFWDKHDAPEEYKYDDTLIFHKIDDKKFLRALARCSGFITTAGFESICEALYFGKPVYAVPVKGHYEQLCNALDTARMGAGIHGEGFDINRFINFLPSFSRKNKKFRRWVESAPTKVVDEICEVLKK